MDQLSRSEQTKAGLEAARARGVRLGRPPSLPDELRVRILGMRRDGMGYHSIAKQLNAEGVPTAQGGDRWWPGTVQKVVDGMSDRETE